MRRILRPPVTESAAPDEGPWVMAATCIHGYPPGACLICQTLGHGPAVPELGHTRTRRRRSTSVEPTAGASRAVQPDEDRAPSRRGSLGLRLTGLALAVVITVLVMWWVIGLVWAVLHILELVAIALAAGYVGFRVGTAHGRRDTRRR